MANDTEGLSEQIRLQREYAKALEDRLKFEKALGLSSSEQSRILSELNKTMDDIEFPSGEADKFDRTLKSTNKTTNNTTSSIREASTSTEKFGDATAKTAKKGKSWTEWLSDQKERILAIGQSLKNAVGSVYNFAKSLFSLVTGASILEGLIEKATSMTINTAFAEAREEVREFAGDLSSGPGKAIMDGFYNLRKQSANLAETGLSLQKVYGRGVEGWAAALKDIKDFAEKLGPALGLMQKEIKESGVNFVMMAKGMGITNEQMAETAKIALQLGKDPLKYAQEFSEMAAKSQKAFGVSAKIMGRGMAELQTSLPHLRREGPKAFAPIVAYAQKLGLELKQVTGTLETFSSVEKGLEAASGLAQMGVYLDPLKLVAESDPAKIMDELTKSFKNAGKAIDLTDRHQRNLVKSILNFDEAQLDTIAGQNKLKKNYQDTQKEAEKAQKAQMTQAQVMQELGKGIKRLIQIMDPGKFTGFFDALTKGFSDGVFMAGPMKKLMWDIKNAMLGVYRTGKEMGIMFVHAFPGVKDMIDGLRRLFNPKLYKEFANSIKNALGGLMKGLEGPEPEKAVQTFLERIRKAFEKWARGTGNFWTNIMPGLKKFSKAAGVIIKEIIKFIAQGVADGMKGLAKIITDGFSKTATNAAGGVASDFGEVFGNIFGPLVGAITESWPIIWDAFKTLMKAVWKKVKPILEGWWEDIKTWWNDTVVPGFKHLFGFSEQGEAKNWGDSIRDAFKEAWEAIEKWWNSGGKEETEKVFEKIKKWFEEDAWPYIKTGLTIAWNKLGEWWEETGKPLVEELWEKIKTEFMNKIEEFDTWLENVPILGGLYKAIKGVVDIIVGAFQTIKGIFTGDGSKILEGLGNVLGGAWDVISGLFSSLSDIVGGVLTGVGKLLAGLGSLIWSALTTAADLAWKGIKKIASIIGDTLADIASSAWEKMKEFGNAIVDGIMAIPDLLLQAFTFLKNAFADGLVAVGTFLFGTLPKAIYDGFKFLGEAIGTGAAKAFLFLTEDVPKFFTETVPKAFSEFVDSAKSFFSDLWNSTKELGGKIVDFFTKDIPEAFSKFVNKMKTFFTEDIPKTFSKVVESTKKFVSDVWEEIKSIPGKLASLGSDIWNSIVEWWENPGFLSKAWNAVKSLGSSLVEGIKNGFNAVYDYFADIVNRIIKNVKEIWGIKSPSSVFAEIGTYLLDGLVSTVKEIPTKISNFFSEAWTNVKEIFNLDKAAELGKQILDGIINGIADLGKQLKEKGKEAWEGFKSIFKPGSPSKEATILGGQITDGLIMGVKDIGNDLYDIMDKAFKEIEVLTVSLTEVLAKRLGNALTAYAEGIVTAGGILDREGVAFAQLTSLGKSFSGGQVQVSHNFPNTKIEVHVTLDSKELGSQLFATDLGVAKKPYYFKNSDTKPPAIAKK